MASPYIGEIRIVGFNFAPQGWALCNGALQQISENEALFNLIGTTYGGDGQQTFALPDLQSRIPIHQGQGPGTSNYTLAQNGGRETVTLTTNQIPIHTHTLTGSKDAAASRSPVGDIPALATREAYGKGTPVAMSPSALTNAGGSQPHTNLQPFLCVNFIISLFGIYPSQS